MKKIYKFTYVPMLLPLISSNPKTSLIVYNDFSFKFIEYKNEFDEDLHYDYNKIIENNGFISNVNLNKLSTCIQNFFNPIFVGPLNFDFKNFILKPIDHKHIEILFDFVEFEEDSPHNSFIKTKSLIMPRNEAIRLAKLI